MSLASMLTETFSIYRSTYASDAVAAAVRSDAALTTGIPCRDQTLGAGEQVMNAAHGIPIDHQIFTLYSGVQHDDVLVISGLLDGETVTATVRVKGYPIRRRAIGGMSGFYVFNAEEVGL